MIYFLQSPDGGRIKIGKSIRLSQRLYQLSCEHGCKLQVLAVIDGSYPEEKAIHRQFAHLRVVNEWFEPGDDLLGFIVAKARPWDGNDEAPPLRKTAMIRVSEDFADQLKQGAGERMMTTAEFCDRFLKPCLDEIHREYINAESKRLDGGDQ